MKFQRNRPNRRGACAFKDQTLQKLLVELSFSLNGSHSLPSAMCMHVPNSFCASGSRRSGHSPADHHRRVLSTTHLQPFKGGDQLLLLRLWHAD